MHLWHTICNKFTIEISIHFCLLIFIQTITITIYDDILAWMCRKQTCVNSIHTYTSAINTNGQKRLQNFVCSYSSSQNKLQYRITIRIIAKYHENDNNHCMCHDHHHFSPFGWSTSQSFQILVSNASSWQLSMFRTTNT